MNLGSSISRAIQNATRQNRFVRHVLLVGGGALTGQAILLLASPLLTRIYSAEDFGTVAIFSAILALSSTIATLRYEVAIPLPETEARSLLLVGLCVACVFSIGLLSAGILALFSGSIEEFVGLSIRSRVLWLLPVGIVGVGLYNTFYYWAVRRKAFSQIAQTRILQSGGSIAVQVIAGLLNPVPLGMIIGQIVGQSLGVGRLGAGSGRKLLHTVWEAGHRAVWDVAQEYRRFPYFTLPSSLINISSAQLPVLLLSRLFGTAVAGWYGVAYRFMLLPITLIGQALATVFFADISEERDAARVGRQVERVFAGLVTATTAPMLLGAIIAPSLFALFFGEQWYESGRYAQVLSPWLFTVLIASPLSTLVFRLGRQRGEIIFQVALLAVRVASIEVGARVLDSPYYTIALFAATSAIAWMVYLTWLIAIAKNRVIPSLVFLAREIGFGLVVTLPTLFAVLLLESALFQVAIAVLNGLAVAWIVFRRARNLLEDAN